MTIKTLGFTAPEAALPSCCSASLPEPVQVLEACTENRALRSGHSQASSEPAVRRPPVVRLQAEDMSSVESRVSSGFGGLEFWDALRQVGLASSPRGQLGHPSCIIPYSA